jgi:hypothetical protein
MATFIRILIKFIVSIIAMFTISALQMAMGFPHWIAAIVILSTVTAIWKWKPLKDASLSADDQELKKN